MSETYTTGGDTLFNVDNPNWGGQTFRVRETHTLEYIDLELRGPLLQPTPVIQVFYAGIDHKPIGTALSRNRYTVESKSSLFSTGRVRFSMQPLVLDEDQYYAIVVSNYVPIGGTSASWLYDATNATYPRGMRISSPDSGTNWTVHYSQDHIFAEFGTPPLPKPDPPPPIDNFAIPGITYTHWHIGLTIRLTTSVPCHLTCFITDKTPLKHHTSRTIRGLQVPWGTYFCFVAWQEVQQSEDGDTLYHTFELPDWLEGQTKWFTFRGDVDLQLTPSVGPIFKHTHPGGLPRYAILRPDSPGDPCLIPSQIGLPCPDHWFNVKDIIPDEDSSCVFATSVTTSPYYLDLYNISTDTFGKINQLTLTARMRRVGGYAYVPVAMLAIVTHATSYYTDPLTLPGTYTEKSRTFTNNPFTAKPWTQQEINDLLIGIALREYWGVGWTASGRCTQVYATIERGINGGPD